MLLGIAGVATLAWEQVALSSGGQALAVGACLGAAACYALASGLTTQRLSQLSPLQATTGSLGASALLLAIPAALSWPAVSPSAEAWLVVLLLAVVSSGAGYLLYFRLVQRIGPTRSMAVTFVIPAFAAAWEFAFFDASPGLRGLVGGVIVLAGTALTMGARRLPVLARWRLLRSPRRLNQGV
jgi:drug/metabolite transporter (DMT)-like permease